MPWPLTAGELRPFIDAGLVLAEWEDFDDDSSPGPPVRRLRAVFTRPGRRPDPPLRRAVCGVTLMS